MIGTYFSPAHPKGFAISSKDMNLAVKNAVTTLDLAPFGFTPALVGSHSLRAGGAMAMHLNGVPAHTIQLMGRWSSDTFLTYIHQQISAFSCSLATRMSRDIAFHNIRGPTTGTISP
jgi:hypothetical protein